MPSNTTRASSVSLKPRYSMSRRYRPLCEVPCAIATRVMLARGLSLLDARRRSEEHTSELQSRLHLVCRLLLEKKKRKHERCIHVPGDQGRDHARDDPDQANSHRFG